MDIGIVGLPRSGKTTIFNAVTRGSVDVSTFGASQGKPNMGVAKVPDDRLGVLEGMFKPKRVVPAEVTYVDIPPAPEGFGETRGISGEFLNYLQRADALLIVARAFEDPSVPHVANSIDSIRDAETMTYELAFADLDILEKRIKRLEAGMKSIRTSERENANKEIALVNRLKDGLESGVSIGDQTLDQDEARMLEGFRFLTAKPIIIAVNVGEDQISDIPMLEDRLRESFTGPRVRTAALCGKLEMELAQMEPDDELEFRSSMEAGESGLNRMIQLSYDVLDLITFLTVGADEVRAWTIGKDTVAVKAASKIHSDIERGFIRAEVVKYEDLTRCGSLAESRKQGVLRQEGKTYMVIDGDVINFLFNV